MKKVTIELDIPTPNHELPIQVACAYYGITKETLMKDRTTEGVNRRAIVYKVLSDELGMSPPEIACIFGFSRQNVSSQLLRIEFQIKMYLQFSCAYFDIKQLFLKLRREQEEWLTRMNNT